VQVQQDSSSGAYVAAIVPGGPAEAAGIQAGDTIMAVDGTAIASPSMLTSVLSSHRPGESVRVTWADAMGRRHTSSIRLVAAT
jgi:S1-C subfamily serine protease